MQRGESTISRRRFLAAGARGSAALGLGLFGGVTAVPIAHAAGADDFGSLLPPDANGLRLPPGFSSRIVAQTSVQVGTTGHTWHTLPDGGATFATGDGGWVYVSNSEASNQQGGVGAIRFAADGAILDAYSILSGTSRNCAGGPTPWNTWLSCEETSTGRVWECDPLTPGSEGTVLPALGRFQHEAAAVDPINQRVFLTEDRPDSLLYRFTPTAYPDLSAGVLEAAEILEDPDEPGAIVPGETRGLAWHVVPDPDGSPVQTRAQVSAATTFNGGEGIWYESGRIVFSTKHDNRIWEIDTTSDEIGILYDFATAPVNPLSGVDNVFIASTGDVYVAEDGGDMEIVALTPSGQVRPIIQITGQPTSEVTGPALSPDGTRLYFSSQRTPGTTYEVTGPFTAPTVPIGGGVAQLLLFASMSWLGGTTASATHDPHKR
ncbi:MAG: translocation protein TolB [Deltaproteobacteria bacterium]|nr:translocation protein TolB [Deltaproteobacteria bacterium]